MSNLDNKITIIAEPEAGGSTTVILVGTALGVTIRAQAVLSYILNSMPGGELPSAEGGETR